MSDNSWTTEIFVPHSPSRSGAPVTNVRGRWNEEIDGGTTDVGSHAWPTRRLGHLAPPAGPQ